MISSTTTTFCPARSSNNLRTLRTLVGSKSDKGNPAGKIKLSDQIGSKYESAIQDHQEKRILAFKVILHLSSNPDDGLIDLLLGNIRLEIPVFYQYLIHIMH